MPDRVANPFAVLACLGALALASGCVKTIKPDAAAASTSDNSSRAAAFFQHPLIQGVEISPDGERVAGLTSDGDEELVVYREVRGSQLTALARVKRDRFGTAMTLAWVEWVANDLLIMSVEEPLDLALVDVQRSRLFSVDLEGHARYVAQEWTGESSTYFQSDVISLLPNEPDYVLLNLRSSSSGYPEAVRVNVRTGLRSQVERPERNIVSWHADHLGRVRAGSGIEKPRREDALVASLVARASDEEPFQTLVRWRILEEDGLGFVAFSEEPAEIFVVPPSDEPGRRKYVQRYRIDQKALGAIVFKHPAADVDSVVTSRTDGRLLYVPYVVEKPEKFMVDEAFEKRQRFVDEMLPNRTNDLTSMSLDETVAIVRSESDVVPPEYYVLRDRELSLLARMYPELAGGEFSPMEPIVYEARDGLQIHGYLTRPVQRPDGPLPTIVVPHGGPWVRDVWGWDPVVQFLASLGFAVFQPNFRGSTGYGADFSQAGIGEWGLAMQDDITDGVRWLIAEGLADPDRIGIFGWSYGGYAALQGLVSTPELYRAGASYAGVSDLRQMMSEVGLRLKHDELMEQLVGDRRADKERLIETSPLQNVDKIRVPVLLGHGTRDQRVAFEQSERMAKALRRRDLPVELYIYKDELHDFLDERNQIHFFSKLGRFFEEHLLGAP